MDISYRGQVHVGSCQHCESRTIFYDFDLINLFGVYSFNYNCMLTDQLSVSVSYLRNWILDELLYLGEKVIRSGKKYM